MLKRYPALSLAVISGFVTAALAAWQSANATGTTNWWLFLLTLIPAAAGAATHSSVVPVDTVRRIITEARSAASAVTALANAVDVATSDRPPVSS